MKDSKLITVDNKEYTVIPYPGEYGYELFQKLLVILGPGFSKLFKLLDDKKEGDIANADVNFDALSDGIITLLMSFQGNPKLLTSLMKEILINTMEGKGSVSVVNDFGGKFQGEYFHGLKLCASTLQEQYSDFLSGSGGLASVLGKISSLK